ncbi:LPS export ABC transporter periplasmic protein LptC [Deefgea piscis]|uniref:LPS export ABC transporter periplasmic protein LptC n=1 Tax=Deefgea piscis TaxID=2739061 RepID=UPI001C816BCB|nr:LPS export ABC transporter periplasmic protein LptC [Deefgea piscis]QZA80522.1 LPS export ABC transporter periplasmic protein LptC [Deefgea piscis]
MRSLTTWVLPLLLLLLVGSLIWALSRVATNLTVPQRLDLNAPDLIADEGVLWRYDEAGIKRSQLIASRVTHVPLQDTMLYEKPMLTQTDASKPTVVVIGTRAKSIHKGSETWFYEATQLRRAPFEGNPELIINGRDIWIDGQAEVAKSDQFVTADMGKNHAEAVGFVANNKLQTLELKSQVKMTYVPTPRPAAVRPVN